MAPLLLARFSGNSVSIALQHNGVLTQAVIYDPTKNDLFTPRVAAALISMTSSACKQAHRTGRLPDRHGFLHKFEYLDAYMNMLRDMMQKPRLRRPGSAALDLAYTAAGRYDGFFELALNLGTSPRDVC